MARETKRKQSMIRETIRIYYRASKKQRRVAAISLLNPVGAVLVSVAVPFFAGRIIAGIANHDPRAMVYIWLAAAAATAGVIAMRFGITRTWVMQAQTMADLNHMVFRRLLERSVGYHTNQISGKIISDANDFVGAYGQLTSALYNQMLSFLMIIIFGLTVVFLSSWMLGIYLLVVVGVTLGWTYMNSVTRAKLRRERLIATKNLIAHASDSIVNVQTVKTFAGEAKEIKRNETLNAKLLKLRIHDWQLAARSSNNRMALLLTLQIGLLFIVFTMDSSNTHVLAVSIFAFTYIMTITTRLFELNTLTRQIEESFLQASPMTRMLLQDIEITDAPGAQPLHVKDGAISIQNVTFQYQETSGDNAVFEGLTLDIKAGERIGLVGPSGGGKSTLTKLLLRFEDIVNGQIAIDGQDITTVTQASLRRAIAYVPQEPLLFHRSIRENIAYGKPDATEAEVQAAAKKAYAHDFVSSLPNGYDTVVGERGVKLSGGQRQRVAIARAILKDAPILVLDEATSALDSESEVEIQKALWQLMKGRTAIVIAHRLSTIQRLDRIVVLDDGTITEQGTHQELVNKKGGLYARLWKHQSGGFLED